MGLFVSVPPFRHLQGVYQKQRALGLNAKEVEEWGERVFFKGLFKDSSSFSGDRPHLKLESNLSKLPHRRLVCTAPIFMGRWASLGGPSCPVEKVGISHVL